MKQHLLKTIGLICVLFVFHNTQAQIGKCKGKYLGNIVAGNVPSNYTSYWNQVTSENGSKWGSVEGTRGVYTFGNSDLGYNWAKNNNGLFKYHTLIWGAQTPGWVSNTNTSAATIQAAIDPYFKAVKDHYAAMGGLKLIDVLNEPVNTPMPVNLRAALTAGYRAEPANANDLNNQYGWAIWCFQLARKHFPDAVLLINEYNVEMNWNNCRAPYIAMSIAIKNAPNLTDGRRNLIDGVGLQAHGINNLTAANFKACIDEIWNKTGLPIHITEFDQTADPNEEKQRAVYAALIPVAWEHPHVAGITFWGYIQGQTWVRGNGQTGPGGTDTGIIYANGTERPAMTWLKQYFAGQASLSCCPAPASFGSCSTTNPVPVVSITAPVNNTVYTEGDNVTINATATITTGSISNVDFYNGTTLLGTDVTAPYTYTITAATAGNYSITAKATSALNAATTSTAIAIQVAKPIYQTGLAPAIDGSVDASWSNFQSVSILKNNSGTVSSTADLSGNWKAMWDATNLYVLVQLTDDIKRNDAGTDVYNDDGVEMYIDMTNTKATTYGTNDHQYTFRWNDVTAAYEINGHSVVAITKSMANTATGYIVEVSIPWATMGGTATLNSFQGFEVMISDDDDGAARDGKIAWSATMDNTWSNPSLMGTVILKGLTCTAPASVITTTTPTTFCASGNVTLTASTGTGYSYVWKNGTTTIAGATASTYTAATAGSYTVQVIHAGSCSTTSAVTTVTVNALPTAAITTTTPTIFCAGGSAVLTASTGLSYLWKNGTATITGATAQTYPATTAGNYTVEVTNTNNCKATSAATTVTVNALPVIASYAQIDGGNWFQALATTVCSGSTLVLGPHPTVETGWSWTGPNGYSATSRAITLSALTTTQGGVYTASYTDGNTCKANATFTLAVNALPTAAITTTTPTAFCAGGGVVLTSSTGSSYLWKNGTATITGATAQTYTASTAGSYTVEVTNTNNCKATSASTTVAVNALPTASITTTTPTAFCAGGSVVLTASAGASYKWFNGATPVGTAQSYTATTAGNYTVEVTNTNNCKATSAATAVTVNALPIASITTTIPTTFCAGGNTALTASAGSSYVWKNGTTTITGATAQTYTAATAGSYAVEVTNANNCKATSAATTVTVNALPTAAITTTTPTTFCAGGSVVLTASAGSSYKWMNGTTTITGATVQTYTAGTAGSYTVEVTNANNCKATSAVTTVTVNVQPTATITTTTPTTFCAGGSLVLTPSAGASYKWFNGTTQVGTTQTYTATTAGSYTVEVTNAGNCSATSTSTTVIVNVAPTATITANGSTNIPQGGSVVLTASAGASYKWFKGSTQVGKGQTYTAITAGVYTVEVTNTTNCAATSGGTNVNINTNQPSVITITSPASNAKVKGAINIAVNVTDPDGSIVSVEYLDGNTVIGTSTTAPYNYTWDNPLAGSHTITVRVTDSNGGITTSAPIIITSEAIVTGVQSSNTLNANIYPNPSNGVVYIDTDVDLSKASFTIVDVLGREVAISPAITGNGAWIDISNLNEDAYVLIIRDGNSVLRKKITVIK